MVDTELVKNKNMKKRKFKKLIKKSNDFIKYLRSHGCDIKTAIEYLQSGKDIQILTLKNGDKKW